MVKSLAGNRSQSTSSSTSSSTRSLASSSPSSLLPWGFTVIEVFVGLLITMISLAIALQIFVSAAYIRARTKQFESAYGWIQQDFETVRSKAAEFESNAVPYSAACGKDPNNSLAATFIQTSTGGLGGASALLGPKVIRGKEYELARTADSLGTTAPDRLVALVYELISTENGNTVLRIEAEVVMYAAFRCP